MFYVKSSIGEEVPITNTNVFTHARNVGWSTRWIW